MRTGAYRCVSGMAGAYGETHDRHASGRTDEVDAKMTAWE